MHNSVQELRLLIALLPLVLFTVTDGVFYYNQKGFPHRMSEFSFSLHLLDASHRWQCFI